MVLIAILIGGIDILTDSISPSYGVYSHAV